MSTPTAEASSLAEMADEVLEDTELARRNVGALLELLRGCPPDYKITGCLFASLLTTALMHLESSLDVMKPLRKNLHEGVMA